MGETLWETNFRSGSNHSPNSSVAHFRGHLGDGIAGAAFQQWAGFAKAHLLQVLNRRKPGQALQLAQVIDPLLELYAAPASHLQHLGLLSGQPVFFQQGVDGSEQQRERGVQFVAHVGEKAGFGHIEVFHPYRLLLDEGILSGQFSFRLTLLVQTGDQANHQKEDEYQNNQGGTKLRIPQAQFQFLAFFLGSQLFFFLLQVIVLHIETGAPALEFFFVKIFFFVYSSALA